MIVCLLTSLGLKAQNGSNLTIFSQNGERFWLIINGERQNSVPSANVKVSGLAPGYFKVKVIFEDEKINSIDQTIGNVDVDNTLVDQTYVVRANKVKKKVTYVLRMVDFKPTQQNPVVQPEPGQQVIEFHTQETKPAPTQPQTEHTTQVPGVQVTVKEEKEQVEFQVKVPTHHTIEIQHQTTVTEPQPSRPTTEPAPTTRPAPATAPAYRMPGYNGPIGCGNMPMSDADFARAKQSISSKSFESDRIKIARQIFNTNCLTTAQVVEIMPLFSFESTRIEFAKFAYGRTHDIGNFFQINDVFSFSSSIDELDDFIQSFKW